MSVVISLRCSMKVVGLLSGTRDEARAASYVKLLADGDDEDSNHSQVSPHN
jgi:hypothetical protein